MPKFIDERLVFTKQEMFDLTLPIMKIMRRAQSGSKTFPETVEPFKATGAVLISGKEVRLLDIHVGVGAGVLFQTINVIGMASESNKLSVIQYLHENKEALHIDSSEFVAAWRCDGDGSGYRISPEIYEFLTKDEKLVAFIKEEYPPEQGLLQEEQLSPTNTR